MNDTDKDFMTDLGGNKIFPYSFLNGQSTPLTIEGVGLSL